MGRRLWLTTLAALALSGASATAEAQRARGRFAGQDRDGDGVITREEWRGNEASFRIHDRNGDGVLSGDEIRAGTTRERADDSAWDASVDRTPEAFARLDHDRDERIAGDEWPSSRERFRLLDRNDDGVLTRHEFLDTVDAPVDRREDEVPANLFQSLDTDGDGMVSFREWRWSRASFEARDADGNGRLTRDEFRYAARRPDDRRSTATAAYQAGQARGLAEGRAAGREDRERRQGWDLEAQRELEQADSGFAPRLGSREAYQAGYRSGFRRGYEEGYGPR